MSLADQIPLFGCVEQLRVLASIDVWVNFCGACKRKTFVQSEQIWKIIGNWSIALAWSSDESKK